MTAKPCSKEHLLYADSNLRVTHVMRIIKEPDNLGEITHNGRMDDRATKAEALKCCTLPSANATKCSYINVGLLQRTMNM